MILSDIIKGIDTVSQNINLNENIVGICSDSRKVKKGYIFVAIKGTSRDGNDYIDEAILNGASVIISENENICLLKSPWILCENARSALAIIWSNYYGNPSKDMKIIAVTGTNGKTSTSYYIYSILKHCGIKSGLISTIETLIDGEKYEINGGGEVSDISSAMTTPDPEMLYKILYDMKLKSCDFVVMEASSHALSQNKLDGLNVDIAVFTNLSAEHLDYHKDMEEYFQAKAKLFEKCNLAIINCDDDYGKRLYSIIKCNKKFCSLKNNADYYANSLNIFENGTEYILKNKNGKYKINTQINGEYNVYNSMLSFAVSCELGIDINNIIDGIENLECIPGRLEKCCKENIYIDYAHTPYAVEKVLLTIKQISHNKKIIALFGCGGNRDKSKRSEMCKIVCALADLAIITSDNSRNENKNDIIIDILKGSSESENYIVIPSRKKAIEYGVSILSCDDVLVLLGKGHENYEIDKNGKHYFNEREIVGETIKKYDINF